jgi:hypothetical protein
MLFDASHPSSSSISIRQDAIDFLSIVDRSSSHSTLTGFKTLSIDLILYQAKTSHPVTLSSTMTPTRSMFLVAFLFLSTAYYSAGFSPLSVVTRPRAVSSHKWHNLYMSDKKLQDDGVVELVDGDEKPKETAQVAPFFSQGELAEGVLNPDLSDPKQARVIIYMIISLVPVLFLIPLMIGSRDLIPLDALPPVELNF